MLGTKLLSKLRALLREDSAQVSVVPKQKGMALQLAKRKAQETVAPKFPLKVYEPPAALRVVPEGKRIAMDDCFGGYAGASYVYGDVAGFPGYPYLSMLATRTEYRAMASSLATELTREWIELTSSETAGDDTKDKITELTKRLKDIDLRGTIQRGIEQDCYFGRAQFLFTFKKGQQDLLSPLVISEKTIQTGSFEKITTVEAIWTTPATYNALYPAAPDFYKPSAWFMLGKQVHASRLRTVITRPLPDMLKPAFNFGGMSLSQLVEPYVENWLRTRQSVADLINNFSIIVLKTNMGQVLDGTEGAETDLFDRADLFTATRSNRGLMTLDKDAEDITQIAVPLGGLHELQAQAQEQMCSASHTPAVVLTGVAPTGFGNVGEGEMVAWRNWCASQQEHWTPVIKTTLDILQLDMYGKIDPDISFEWVPLFQMTPKELADIRTADATTAATLIDRNVIDAQEERERLARDKDSGYQGLDLGKDMEPLDEETEDDGKEA